MHEKAHKKKRNMAAKHPVGINEKQPDHQQIELQPAAVKEGAIAYSVMAALKMRLMAAQLTSVR